MISYLFEWAATIEVECIDCITTLHLKTRRSDASVVGWAADYALRVSKALNGTDTLAQWLKNFRRKLYTHPQFTLASDCYQMEEWVGL